MRATILILVSISALIGIPVLIIFAVSPPAKPSDLVLSKPLAVDSGRAKPSAFSLEMEAQFLLQKRVKQAMKTPTTAKFQLSSEYHKNQSVVAVGGFVTAQNPFGAMITQKVTGVYFVNDSGGLEMATISLDGELLDSDSAAIRKAEGKG